MAECRVWAEGGMAGIEKPFWEPAKPMEELYDTLLDPIEVRMRIGMVFQKPNPFPKSIYDNIAYGPRLNGITDRSKLDAIVEKSLRAAAL